jgi:hypothetical protein
VGSLFDLRLYIQSSWSVVCDAFNESFKMVCEVRNFLFQCRFAVMMCLPLMLGAISGRASANPLFTKVSAPSLPKHSIVAVADFDGDGTEDLLVNVVDTSTGLVSLKIWSRSSGFNYSEVSAKGLADIEVVSVADFNGDGLCDLLHVSSDRTVAKVCINGGGGDFHASSIPETEASLLFGFQDGVRAVDIDGDGDVDLVFGRSLGSGGSIVSVLNQSRNGGSKTQPFSGSTTLAVTKWVHNKAEITDANGDGKPDILSVRTTGSWPSGTHPDFPVTIFINSGKAPSDYLNSGNLRSVAGFIQIDDCGIAAANVMSPLVSWDIDNDGDLDLINGSSDWRSVSRPHVYLNDGSGNYTQIDSPVYQSGSYYHHGVCVFDADLDNDLDAVWTSLHNFSDIYPRIWRNDGNRRFSDVTGDWGLQDRIESGNLGMGGYFADLDGDGDLDFVVELSNGWGDERIFSVYRNDAVDTGSTWLKVKLKSSASPSFGLGARVEVTANGKTLTQYLSDVSGGVRNMSGLTFGLGRTGKADSVTVYWPSGVVTRQVNVSGNRVLELSEQAVEVTAPTIVSQPSGGVLPRAGTFSVSVSAKGSEPLKYEWMRDGKVLSGAATDTLAVTSAGIYTVVVSNGAGSITSNSASVTDDLSSSVGYRLIGLKSDTNEVVEIDRNSGLSRVIFKLPIDVTPFVGFDRNPVDGFFYIATTGVLSGLEFYRIDVENKTCVKWKSISNVTEGRMWSIGFDGVGNVYAYGERGAFDTGDLWYVDWSSSSARQVGSSRQPNPIGGDYDTIRGVFWQSDEWTGKIYQLDGKTGGVVWTSASTWPWGHTGSLFDMDVAPNGDVLCVGQTSGVDRLSIVRVNPDTKDWSELFEIDSDICGIATMPLLVDTTVPVVSVTNVSSNARLTSVNATFSGKIVELGGQPTLQYRVGTTGGWTAVPVTGSGSPYAFSQVVTLRPGPNTVQFQATDSANNASAVVSLPVSYVVSSTLKVLAPESRDGTVSSGYRGSTLREVGVKYSVTAAPASGMVFKEWLKNGARVSTSATLSFLMESGLVLTPVFVPDFSKLAGVYNGLVGTGEIGSGTAADMARFASGNGFVSITMGSTGGFTGVLHLEGRRHAFTGSMGTGKVASVTVPRGDRGAAVLSMRMTSALPGELSGSVLVAGRDLGFRALRGGYVSGGGAHPLSGVRYNIGLPGAAKVMGHGFGTVLVEAGGSAVFAGKLASGQACSAGARIVDDGDGGWVLPVFVGGTGVFSGELMIPKTAPSSGSEVSGNFEWLKPASAGGFVPAGFLRRLEAIGSRHVPESSFLPAGGTFLAVVDADRRLLPSALSQAGTWSAQNMPSLSSPTRLRMSYNPLSGSFAGTFNRLVNGFGVSTRFDGVLFSRPVAPTGGTALRGVGFSVAGGVSTSVEVKAP